MPSLSQLTAMIHRRRRVTPVASLSFDAAQYSAFTRASDARFFDQAGVVQVASSNVLRNAHYLLGRRGVLLEPSSQNILLRSRELNDAYWTKSNTTISADATNGPDGSATADKLVENTANNFHTIERASLAKSSAASLVMSLSGFAKAAERTQVLFWLRDNATQANRAQVQLNLANGTIVNPLATGTYTGVGARIVPLADGWYYFTLRVVTGTEAAVAVRAFLVDASNQNSYLGDGTSGLFLTDLQVQEGEATSYIPTVATAQTRAADALSAPFAGAWQAMTVYARIVSEMGTGFSAGTYFSLKSAAATPVLSLNRDTTGNYRLSHDNGSAVVHGAVGAAATRGNIIELRGIVYADGSVQAGISINGGAESIGAVSAANAFSATLPDRVEFGSVLNAPLPFSHFLVANGVHTLAQMRGVTGA